MSPENHEPIYLGSFAAICLAAVNPWLPHDLQGLAILGACLSGFTSAALAVVSLYFKVKNKGK
jgi:hypothetical protein